MKKLDYVILALVAALSLVPLVFFSRDVAGTVVVTQHGETIYEGSLSAESTVAAEGCTVVIENGCAYVAEADCPDGLCVSSGPAAPAHPVVCLPNELVIRVETSADEEAYDGVVY